MSEVIDTSPVCASSSLAFCMMYSAYKLNKQGDNILPWCTPFPIWNQSISMCISNCCFLICIQISQEAGMVVWYSHLFKNFPVCCDPPSQRLYHSQGSRSGWFPGILLLFWWSSGCWKFDLCSSPFSKTSLNVRKFTVHVLLKPGLENFEHYFVSVWDECNCVVGWTFFGIAFLWGWNENWPFPVLRPLLSFPNLLAYWV